MVYTVLKRFLMKPCYVFAISLCLTSALSAETKPTYNMYGTLGMIDMPSAEMTSDGMLAISEGYFKGGLRTTVTSQILPNISASFRYAGHGVNGDEALGHINLGICSLGLCPCAKNGRQHMAMTTNVKVVLVWDTVQFNAKRFVIRKVPMKFIQLQ